MPAWRHAFAVVGAGAHQAAGGGKFAIGEDRGNLMLCRQRYQPIPVTIEKTE